MNKNKVIIKIGNKIGTQSIKTELFLLILVALVSFLKLFSVPKSGLIAMVVLLSIGIIYFIAAFTENKDSEISVFTNFLQKLIGFSSAYSCVGLLFSLQRWPYGFQMLIVSIIALLICLLLSISQIKKDKSHVIRTFSILRLVILPVILLVFTY